MAIRNDISINWKSSPRLITIENPSVNVTMQDLYDTLRERELIQIDEPYIINGAGKEPLGGGVLVGLTLTLNDALIQFEARPGPEYVLCTLGGGNLVAQDSNGNPLVSPINPTSFVSIVQSNSSSATLQELSSIQFSSFNGGVTIDIDNISGKAASGTTFPTGTLQQPSDNTKDGYIIADENGFTRFYIIGDLNLVAGTEAFARHEFKGESPLKTHIFVHPDADILNCEFYDCTVSGTLDGNSHIEKSVISDLSFVDGYIKGCALGPSRITLGFSTIANIFSCYSTVPGTSSPIIDLNGTGILALRDYFGGVLLENYYGNGSHSIDLSSGQVKLNPDTITGGTFVVRGVGKLINSQTGEPIHTGTWNNGVTIINELLTATEIQNAVGVWSEEEKQENLAYSKKASDNAEQVNDKIQ